jgi:hypothetical protein
LVDCASNYRIDSIEILSVSAQIRRLISNWFAIRIGHQKNSVAYGDPESDNARNQQRFVPLPHERYSYGAHFRSRPVKLPVVLISAFPHRLPRLHQFLDEMSRRKAIVTQAASVMDGAVEVLQGGDAHLGKLRLKVGEISPREGFLFIALGRGSHRTMIPQIFVFCSPI